MCKIFSQAEQDFSLSLNNLVPLCKSFSLEYLQEVAEFLSRDKEFPEFAAKELAAAETVIHQTTTENIDASFIRALNTIRHILLAETGQQTADWDFIDHQGKLDAQRRNVFSGMNVFLEDIRSPFNIGSMFRSAESFGVEQVFLSLLCADPNHPRAQRTAMGCIDVVPWQRTNLEDIEGPLFVLETGGTNMNDFDFPPHGTMIVGSEELGASPKALEAAEKSLGRVTIQTFGAKGSLNAGTAFGIALQAWANYLAVIK
jgi:TrmH family RNA methyltransferase